MKVCVLGSGNGGQGVAYDFAAAGHQVALWDFERFGGQVEAIRARGGIEARGQLEGFARLDYAGFDLARASADAELVMLVGPAYATEGFAVAVGAHLRPGVAYVVCPTSFGGALLFKRCLNLRLGDDTHVVAEMSTLPYAVRAVDGVCQFHLKLKGGLFLATLPGRLVDGLLPMLQGVYPALTTMPNVLGTMLVNGNVTIHPAVSLLNAGLIDRTGGNFMFYEEGVTEHVGNLMAAVDEERRAIGAALGIDIPTDPELGVRQGYMTEATYHPGYANAPGFRGIRAQPGLDHRYFTEDVGFSMVFLSDLGRRVGVPTPVIDAMILIVSKVMRRDFAAEQARTLATLGLGDWDAAALRAGL